MPLFANTSWWTNWFEHGNGMSKAGILDELGVELGTKLSAITKLKTVTPSQQLMEDLEQLPRIRDCKYG